MLSLLHALQTLRVYGLQNIIHIVDNILDRRNNAAISTAEANATLAKIDYTTMLQYPAASPSSTQALATAG